MTDQPAVEELTLSDAQLVELLKNHEVDRRTLLRIFGVGSAVSLGAGSVAAKHDEPHPQHIDSHYGYAAPKDEQLPKKLQPDHTVGLHIDNLTERIPFHFDPMGIHIEVGDIVRFNFHTPDHTVTAYHLGQGRQQRVPDAAPPFTSPMINAGGFWLYQFDHPGTYDLYCGPHQIFGMVMRLVVGDPDSSDYDDEFSNKGRPPVTEEELEHILPGVEENEWTLPTSAEIFATDAMSVENIVKEEPVTRSNVLAELSDVS